MTRLRLNYLIVLSTLIISSKQNHYNLGLWYSSSNSKSSILINPIDRSHHLVCNAMILWFYAKHISEPTNPDVILHSNDAVIWSFLWVREMHVPMQFEKNQKLISLKIKTTDIRLEFIEISGQTSIAFQNSRIWHISKSKFVEKKWIEINYKSYSSCNFKPLYNDPK